jgi:uncharacterized protein (DUF1501 family)
MAIELTRRAALLGLTSAWSLGNAALALAASPGDARFVVVILRGALDGLAAVPPYGDARLADWRAPLIPPGIGQPGGMLDLGGFFGLHPALAGMHDLYAQGDLLPIHAVAGNYRSRSHFEAQDCLESGGTRRLASGWLNRAVQALPQASRSPGGAALSVGMAVPLLLQGPALVGAWAPQSFTQPTPDLYARIAALNHGDPITGPAIEEGLRARGFATVALDGVAPAEGTEKYGFRALAETAGHLLAAPDGPRIAALEVGGWDTHAAQAQRLEGPLRQLDAGMVALRAALGDCWRQTAVLVMTEFGRTVRINGTNGTDHGTATVAFVAGGAVAGGRVAGTWPGLSEGQMFENRDLAPTTDLRAVTKGLLAGHLGLSEVALGQVFPDSADAGPLGGLLRPA